MQADNDNLQRGVEGIENWEALHEAARKVVEACANERAHSHQVSGREEATGETDLKECGRADHARLSGRESVGSTNFGRRMTLL